MADTYRAPRGFQCRPCSKIDIIEGRAGKCSRCDSTDLRLIDIKEAIIKQAERTGAQVEFVEDADRLMALGGVGCLLRYLAPDQMA